MSYEHSIDVQKIEQEELTQVEFQKTTDRQQGEMFLCSPQQEELGGCEQSNISKAKTPW